VEFLVFFDKALVDFDFKFLATLFFTASPKFGLAIELGHNSSNDKNWKIITDK
jgi:hypothetical protein